MDKMLDRDWIKDRLVSTWSALEEQHKRMIADVLRENGNPYETKKPDGSYVLVDVLLAKANVLSAMVNLEILEISDERTARSGNSGRVGRLPT